MAVILCGFVTAVSLSEIVLRHNDRRETINVQAGRVCLDYYAKQSAESAIVNDRINFDAVME
jgi:hypothetical protein